MFIETNEYQHLEKYYPHIARKILLMWGSPEMIRYFNDLLVDSRGGIREGFSLETVNNIFHLKDVHKREFFKYVNISGKVRNEKKKQNKVVSKENQQDDTGYIITENPVVL